MPVRQKLLEKEPAQDTLEGGPAIIFLDLPACRLHQPPVFDAGRAGRLASPAIKTKIDVFDETLTQRQSSALHLDHLVDAAARRVHFQSQLAIRRAGVQAKPAVDTLGIVVPARRFARTVAGCALVSFCDHACWRTPRKENGG